MARFQRLACPSCGGALDVPTQHEQFFKCATCGSALEDTQYTAPTRQVSLSLADVLAQAGLDDGALPSYAATATKTVSRIARGIGIVVTLLLVGGIGIGVWATTRAVRTATIGDADDDGFGIYGFANSALVTDDGPVGEVALVTNGPDGERLIYVDLGSDDPVRWNTPIAEILPADASVAGYERLIASPTRVLMTFEDHLYAFDRATGSLVYEHGLPDAVVNYCQNCLRVLGDTHLAGLTAEGTLQVWDVATGVRRWSTNVPGDVPRHLLDAGGNPAVATRTDDHGGAVTVYNVADGTVAQRQSVQCAGERTGQVHPFDRLVELDDGGYLWLGGISPACLQRWSVGGTAPDWEAPMALDPVSNAPVALVADDAIVSGSTVVLPSRTGFATVDVSTGSVELFPRPDVRDQRPIALVGDTAVVVEYNSRGTGKWLLVGVNTAASADSAGAAAWQFELEGDDGSDGSITGREWVVESTPAGVAIVEFDVDASKVRTRLVDPETGTAGAPATLAIDDLVFTQLVGWRNGHVVIGADDRLIEIDPATAAIVQSAPEPVARPSGVR
jgi:outer membrane protein assembly factor BamB